MMPSMNCIANDLTMTDIAYLLGCYDQRGWHHTDSSFSEIPVLASLNRLRSTMWRGLEMFDEHFTCLSSQAGTELLA